MKRAVGIVRVSEVGDREGDSFASPRIQAERIRAACERDGLELIAIHEELDVSGSTPLERREGLRRAVELVEAQRADVIMVAYFDRLVRQLKIQQEVIERVEAAGGEVLTLDFGKLTNGTAVERLTGNFIGAVAQFVSEQAGEKVAEAQERAIARGVPIGPVPPGYLRGADKRYTVDPRLAPVVRECFERRAMGATSGDLRAFLAEHGVERTVSGVRKMLASRLYLGEIHYGAWHNISAHEPIISRDLFEQVQRMSVPAGRKAKSERLLARQGILRCGTCGGRMSLNGYAGRTMFYRCGNDSCEKRVTVGADLVERRVLAALSALVADASSVASAAAGAYEAHAAVKRAQAELDAAVRGYTTAGVLGEGAAIERLAELRAARDTAQELCDALGREPAARIYGGREIVERGSVDARRELLRALGCRVVISPGKRPDRIAISFEQALGFGV